MKTEHYLSRPFMCKDNSSDVSERWHMVLPRYKEKGRALNYCWKIMLFTRTLKDWWCYVHSTDTENDVPRKQMCSKEQVPEKGLKPRCPSPKSIFFLKPCRALLLIHLQESSHSCLGGKELPFPPSILLILWETVDHSSIGGHSRWSARILDQSLTRNMNRQGQGQPARPFIWPHGVSQISYSFLVSSIKKTKIFLRGISWKGWRVENVCGSGKSCIFTVNCKAEENIRQRENGIHRFLWSLAYARICKALNSILFLDIGFVWILTNALFYEQLHWSEENLQTTSPTQSFIDHLQEQLSWMKDGMNLLPLWS